MKKTLLTILAGLGLASGAVHAAAPSLQSLPKPNLAAIAHSREVDYRIDPSKEQFWVRMPASRASTYGLVVYTSPNDGCTGVPTGWEGSLDRRHLIFIAPQRVGNGQPVTRRLGLGVMAALAMEQTQSIDPSRVYAAGLSGGARISSGLGFYQSDVFHGTIQDCGTNFSRKVPLQLTANKGEDYGVMPVSPQEFSQARATVKFCLITGPGDFRHGNILDIVHGGFEADGFQVKLIDVPKMGHEDCKGTVFEQALTWVDAGH